MKVQQLMTRQPLICTPEDSCAIAAGIMREHDVGCVPVVASKESERLHGILTDRDICLAAYGQRKRLDEIPVESAMSAEVVSCGPVDEVTVAEKLMKKARVRRLPVADSTGRLLGIVSLADIARAADAAPKSEPGEVTQAEIGRTLSAICRPEPLSPAS